MNRLINMVLRRLVRQAINSGIDAAARGGQGGHARPLDDDAARRMKQSAKLMRRLTRF